MSERKSAYGAQGDKRIFAEPDRSHALRGNAARDAPASQKPNAERPLRRSHAERGNDRLDEHLAGQSMPLHLFIKGTTRQLQFFKHRFHITLVPGQCRAQAMRFEGFLLRRQ